MNPPLRIMFDIETLSTRPTACVLSIGAVIFGGSSAAPADYPREFYVNVSDPEGTIDADTVLWWLSQDKAAQDRLQKDRMPLGDALFQFLLWVSVHCNGPGGELQQGRLGRKDVEFWSRSPSFDEVILTEAGRRAGTGVPFNYRASRDCRTIEALAGFKADSTSKQGVLHDALADAKMQADTVQQCLDKLRIL